MSRLRPDKVGGIVAAAIAIGILSLSLPCSANDLSEKLDPRLQVLLGTAPVAAPSGGPEFFARAGEEWVEVFVEGDLNPGLVEALGGELGTVVPGVAVVRLPVSRLPDLAAAPEIRRVQAARTLLPLLNRNATETQVVECWGGTAPSFAATGHTGRGVIVGIVDTGIDILHQDFRKVDGKTRILTIWDHVNSGVPHPTGFSYGREWSAAEVDAGRCNVTDWDGHGTHTAGVAAANGRATGNGKPAYTYVGMAPEADLVVVRLSAVTDARILDGVAYIFQKAAQLGKDAVVCVPFGKQSGPHDGSDPLDKGIDALTGPGRIVVVPAGNDGKSKIHARVRLGDGTPPRIAFNVASEPQPGAERVILECWYDPTVSLALSVRSPRGTVIGPVGEGQMSGLSSTDGYVTLLGNNPRAASGAKRIEIWLNRIGTNVIGAGEWTVDLLPVGGGAGMVDFWISEQSVTTTIGTGEDSRISLTSPGTAAQALTVGAYAVNTRWVNQSGTSMWWSDAVTGDLANFSSLGPRRDWLRKPDISASGFGVVSSLSKDGLVWSAMVVEDGVHYMAQGTSAASAVVTGAVALLLQEFPGLDPASVKQILWTRAKVDSYTGPLFRGSSDLTNLANLRWGGGKLSMDVPSQTGIADESPGGRALSVVLGVPYPNPMNTPLAQVPIELAAPSFMRVGVYDVQGREVRVLQDGELSAGAHVLAWDGTDGRSHPVPSGRYYVVATNRTSHQSRAIVLVR